MSKEIFRLPVKFTMRRYTGDKTVYTVIKDSEDFYTVQWPGNSATYSSEQVREFVRNGTWLIEKIVTPAPEGIKVGDTVEVIDDGKIYPAYEEWAIRQNLAFWKYGGKPIEGSKLKVVAVDEHLLNKAILLGVQDPSTYVTYIIGVDGVKRVESEPEANGVDAEGNPLNFTEDMLKPFQRVELRDRSGIHIVAHNVQSGYDTKWALIHKHGWNTFSTNRENRGSTEPSPFDVVAVYEAPGLNYELFDFDVKGKLVWTADTKAQVTARQKELQQKLITAATEVASATARMNAIKEELQAVK